MKKLLCAICIGLLSAGAAHADVVLDIPVAANYPTSTMVTTNVMDPNSTATFDITYTVTAISNDTNALVGVAAGGIGVGSDNDVAAHFNTLEGSGSDGANGSTAGGEGLSFTGLTISNFHGQRQRPCPVRYYQPAV